MSLFSIGKNFIKNNPKFIILAAVAYRLIGGNRKRIKGENNKIVLRGAFVSKARFVINGQNNIVLIKDTSLINNISVSINGDNNKVVIGEKCAVYDTNFCIEDNNGEIFIGNKTRIFGKCELAAIEGTKIKIGENCLISSSTHFRTGDSHSIVDLEGNRINPSKDIELGNHTWVGTRVLVTKGAATGENTVIGAGAILTKNFGENNGVVLAGSPAKIVKENINWDINRI